MSRRIGGAGGGSDKGPGKAKTVVVAAAGAAVVAAGGGGAIGSVSSAGSSATSAGSSSIGKNLLSRKADGKKSARGGKVDEAWDRLGMRTLKKAARQHTECVSHSFGEVQRFLARTQCTSMDRMLFALGDGEGTVVVSVVWVGFRTRAQATEFRSLMDEHGTGDIEPLGGELVDAAGIRFNGHNYDSQLNRTVLTIAETEALSGKFSADDLDAVAEVAALLPRP